eukprot:TRINITY_DN6204_c0_g1_i1.p1 TRINITY_DN6204_c0_g1~~TRINITY_DN6204_c0_g1_i1.p1  ORF type:complete len:457 (-),score=85.94 TRINITY_DN6204_c0_g1_i1:17-1387(-)
MSIRQKVEDATDDILFTSDWKTNFEIIDMLRSDPSLTRDFVGAIYNRLQLMEPKTIVRSIELMDACMKNIQEVVVKALGRTKALHELLIQICTVERIEFATKDIVLDFIQHYGLMFESNKSLLYYSTYKKILYEGVQYPPERTEDVAIPNDFVVQNPPENQAPSSPRNFPQIYSGDITSENIFGVLPDMLEAVDCLETVISDYDIAISTDGRKVWRDCSDMRTKLMSLLQNSELDEAILIQLLGLNDTIGELLNQYTSVIEIAVVENNTLVNIVNTEQPKSSNNQPAANTNYSPENAFFDFGKPTTSNAPELGEEEFTTFVSTNFKPPPKARTKINIKRKANTSITPKNGSVDPFVNIARRNSTNKNVNISNNTSTSGNTVPDPTFGTYDSKSNNSTKSRLNITTSPNVTNNPNVFAFPSGDSSGENTRSDFVGSKISGSSEGNSNNAKDPFAFFL